MKILKHGNVEQRKFVCKKCGCEFVAGTSDITWHQCEYNKDAVECPCGRLVAWDNGEPYEEPTPTQDDRERLENLLGNSPMGTEATTEYLLSHGVTFRGGEYG